jgi:hypothetical protein
MTYAREYPLYSTSTLVGSSEITTALPGVGCARCADPNRRNLSGEFLPPVAGPHGHCHACGRVLRLGDARDDTRACSPCFRQALEVTARAYARERSRRSR